MRFYHTAYLVFNVIKHFRIFLYYTPHDQYKYCPRKENNRKTKFQSFKVYFNNIPEGHRPMCIYTMYAGMSTGKYNDK